MPADGSEVLRTRRFTLLQVQMNLRLRLATGLPPFLAWWPARLGRDLEDQANHAAQLELIKEHVNKVDELEEQLREARESASLSGHRVDAFLRQKAGPRNQWWRVDCRDSSLSNLPGNWHCPKVSSFSRRELRRFSGLRWHTTCTDLSPARELWLYEQRLTKRKCCQ
jgi:hypothetical protein